MNFFPKLFFFSVVSISFLILLLIYHNKNTNSLSSNVGSNNKLPNEITIYCAAGIKTPITKAAKLFQKQYGIKINIEFGGSGSLLSRLEIGKRGDLYLAADESYMLIAEEKGLISSQIPIAIQKPVLAVQNGNPNNLLSLKDLLNPRIKLSLGNPDAASIGKLTKIILSKNQLWHKIKANTISHGVFKPTVSEIAIDIEIGAADATIIWNATAAQYEKIETIELPELNVHEQKISVALLNSSKNKNLSMRFTTFLNSAAVNELFEKSGYKPIKNNKESSEATP